MWGGKVICFIPAGTNTLVTMSITTYMCTACVLIGKGLSGLGAVSHRLSEIKSWWESYAKITSNRRK